MGSHSWTQQPSCNVLNTTSRCTALPAEPGNCSSKQAWLRTRWPLPADLPVGTACRTQAQVPSGEPQGKEYLTASGGRKLLALQSYRKQSTLCWTSPSEQCTSRKAKEVTGEGTTHWSKNKSSHRTEALLLSYLLQTWVSDGCLGLYKHKY